MLLIKIDRPYSRHVYWSHNINTNFTSLQFEDHAMYRRKNGAKGMIGRFSKNVVFDLITRVYNDFPDTTNCFLIGYI